MRTILAGATASSLESSSLDFKERTSAIAAAIGEAFAQGRQVPVLTEHADKTDVRIIDFVDTGHPALLRMRDKQQRGHRATGYRISTHEAAD